VVVNAIMYVGIVRLPQFQNHGVDRGIPDRDFAIGHLIRHLSGLLSLVGSPGAPSDFVGTQRGMKNRLCFGQRPRGRVGPQGRGPDPEGPRGYGGWKSRGWKPVGSGWKAGWKADFPHCRSYILNFSRTGYSNRFPITQDSWKGGWKRANREQKPAWTS